MYFRFPILFILVTLFLGGFFYYTTKYMGSRQSLQTSVLREPAPTEHEVVDPVQRPVDSTTDALATIQESELRAHLEFLADDQLEGRDTASRGARIAAVYIANQFRRIGLEAVGEGTSYYQSISLKKSGIMPESALSIHSDSTTVSLEYGRDFLIVSKPTRGKVAISGDLVFTGFGIQAPEYSYDSFEGIDVAGKITVHLSGEPASDSEDFFDGEKRTKYSNGATKRKIADRLGASGTINILNRETLDRIGWRRMRSFFTRSNFSIDQREVHDSDTDLPSALLHPDAAHFLFPDSARGLEELLNTDNGGIAAFNMNRGATLEIQSYEQFVQDRNVVGFLEGSDPQLKSEVVVFTAHYDHVGIGAPVAGDSIYNGAADNASGVAGLIELAEAFVSISPAPKRSILFLAVTAEEKGLLGSEYYLRHPIFPLQNTIANFNLDMLGIGDSTGIVVYGIERSTLGDIVKKAAGQLGLAIIADELPEQRIFYRSDHFNFAKRGIPAIYPSFGIRRDGFEEFQKYYHKPNDDWRLPFNYRYFRKQVQVLFLSGLQVANATERPEWAPGDEFEKIN
ncbi:M28 family peptidase [bacterium]|nr:M28 family peptidase [bacterium]